MGSDEELEQFEQPARGLHPHAPRACGLKAQGGDLRKGIRRANALKGPLRGARAFHFPCQPTQAPPFWSIAWPVTPRASSESSQATVPAISSG